MEALCNNLTLKVIKSGQLDGPGETDRGKCRTHQLAGYKSCKYLASTEVKVCEPVLAAIHRCTGLAGIDRAMAAEASPQPSHCVRPTCPRKVLRQPLKNA